jgi:small subunit ribosomal protein S16
VGEVVLKIRLKRVGGKKQPSYRIVLADSRAARDGSFIEQLGLYDPKTDPSSISIDMEKTREWITKGAQTTDSVSRIINTYENQSNQKES